MAEPGIRAGPDPVHGRTAGNEFLGATSASGPNPWNVATIGDFNLDGHPDLVWQYPVSGAGQVWLMTGAQGTTLAGTAVLSAPNPWRIAGPN